MMLFFKLSQIMAFLIACGCISNLQPETMEDSSKCNFNLILCIDSSTSVSDTKFNQEVDFTQSYYNKVNELTDENVELAIILFATDISVTLEFSKDITVINNAFKKTKENRIHGATFTIKCLDKAKNMTKTNSHPNILLVVTDGLDSSINEYILKRKVYDLVHNHNFLIHAAQFGSNTNQKRLMELTYNQKNIITEDSYEEIDRMLNAFIVDAGICKELQTCENLPYMAGIKNSEDCQNKMVGESCLIECEDNYIQKNKTITCLGRNTWNPLYACEKPYCEKNLVIPNSDNPVCPDHRDGDQCQINCSSDYILNTSTEMLCVSPNWTNIPSCDLKKCLSNPRRVNNAESFNCRGAKIHERCFVTCNEGYRNRDHFFVCEDEDKWAGNVECIEKKTCTDPALETSKNLFLKQTCLEKIEGQTCEIECLNGYQEQTRRSTKEATCSLNQACSDIEGADSDTCTYWKNLPVCEKPKCLVAEGSKQYEKVNWEGCSDSFNGQNCSLACKENFLSLETINITLCVIEDCSDGEKDCEISVKWENVPECVASIKTEKLEKVAPLVLMGASALTAAVSAVALTFASFSGANNIVNIPTGMWQPDDLYGGANIQDTEILII